MWFVVPRFPHNLHLSEAPHFQRFRFAGVESVSKMSLMDISEIFSNVTLFQQPLFPPDLDSDTDLL